MPGVQIFSKVTRNRFPELAKQARRAAARRNKETAETAARIARDLVPVDTGALRSTIRVETDTRSGDAATLAGDEQVDYAVFIHEGTHLTEGHPFLREAAKLAAKKASSKGVSLYKG